MTSLQLVIIIFAAFLCYKSYSELELSAHYLDNLNLTVSSILTPKVKEDSSFVIATVVNYGYLNHLYNFDCYMRRLGLKYIVFALDSQSYQNLTSPNNKQYFYSAYLQLPGENDVSSSASEFRTLDFNIITARKTVAVLSLLRLGLDVLFLDIDVVLLRDPRPYLFWHNVLYVHSLNYPCDSINQHWGYYYNRRIEGNTGFYFVRSSPQTIALWEEVYVWMKRSFRIDDQTYFWRILRGLEYKSLPLGECRHTSEIEAQQNITLCMLNSCLFSSGMISSPSYHEKLVLNLAAMNETPVSIHANFIKSKEKKLSALQNYHLWLIPEESAANQLHSCASFDVEKFKQNIK